MKKLLSMISIVIGSLTASSLCLAEGRVSAGTYCISGAPVTTRTEATILFNGAEARRLYQTLEGMPEVKDLHAGNGVWDMREGPAIRCFRSSNSGPRTYECTLTVTAAGEALAPQRQAEQQQQPIHLSLSSSEQQVQLPQQQQQQCVQSFYPFE